MTSFKVLFAFLAMFLFSIQTAVALPGNTESIPSAAAAVKNYNTAAQKSPAPAEGEPFQRGKYCYGTCNKQKKCNCQEGKATHTCSCVHPDAKCSCWVV